MFFSLASKYFFVIKPAVSVLVANFVCFDISSNTLTSNILSALIMVKVFFDFFKLYVVVSFLN